MLCDRTKEEGAAMWQRTKRAREISTTPSTHDRFTARTERNSEAENTVSNLQAEHIELREMRNTYAWRRAKYMSAVIKVLKPLRVGGCKFGQVTRSLSQTSVILRVSWYS